MKHKKVNMKFLSLAIVLTLLLGVLAACGGNDDTDAGATEGEETSVGEKDDDESFSENSGKDTLIVATENEPPSVHPAGHNATAGTYVNMLTHDTLVILDENMEFQPSLATEWENVSETEWVFKLRDDVYFHNGDHMTAEDVAESLLWVKDYPQVLQYNKGIVDTEVLGDYEVKVITDGPQASFLYDIIHHANMIYPKDLMDSGHDFGDDPVGTGPYIFENWVSGEKLDFVANEDYFDEDRKAQIPNISWRIIPEGSSRTIALENGEVDYVIEVATNDVAKLQENPKTEVLEEANTGMDWMMINTEIEPFNNVDFRKALNAATDREAIVQVAHDGFAIPTASQAPIEMLGSNDEGVIDYDPEKAKEYMEASGLNPADVSFSIICSDDTKTRAAQVMQANFHEILGIDVEIERMDLATYLDVTAEGTYEAAIGGYNASNMLSYLKGVYHSESVGGSNKTRTADPKLDEMIDEASNYLDDLDGQAEFMEETVAYLNTELVPQVPLYQKTSVRAYGAGLKGVNISMSGTTYYNLFSWN